MEEQAYQSCDLVRVKNTLESEYYCWILWTPAEANGTLIDTLREKFTKPNTEYWENKLALGGIYINGVPAFCDQALPFPCKLECYFSKPDAKYPAFDPAWIVYQDDYILVCFKPYGLPTQAPRDQLQFNLRTYLQHHLGQTIHMPSRLDTSVCGLVLASLNPGHHSFIQEQYSDTAEKYYLMEVSGDVGWEEKNVDLPIAKHDAHPVLRRIAPHGKKALTIFRRLANTANHSTYLQARPVTGRTHQIRLHAAAIGKPIIGDNFYGGANSPDLHLVSYSISVNHPIRHNRLRVDLPPVLLPSWASACTAL